MYFQVSVTSKYVSKLRKQKQPFIHFRSSRVVVSGGGAFHMERTRR